VLDSVNRRDRFTMKKLRSSARGASFHTKHASNANVREITRCKHILGTLNVLYNTEKEKENYIRNDTIIINPTEYVNNKIKFIIKK
jgi:hypothetical protein